MLNILKIFLKKIIFYFLKKKKFFFGKINKIIFFLFFPSYFNVEFQALYILFFFNICT